MLSGNQNNVDTIIPKSSIFGIGLLLYRIHLFVIERGIELKEPHLDEFLYPVSCIALIVFNVHIFNLYYITCSNRCRILLAAVNVPSLIL